MTTNSLIGQHVKRYRIDALLGHGGMGSVFRAFDTNLQRPVAFKVMHEHLSRDPEFRQRFWKEAQVAARLDHPGIVRIHDLGSQGDLLYLVMAYVPGISLRHALTQARERGGRLDLREASEALAQVAEALDYAHRQGVIHRDVKPDNVLLQPTGDPETGGHPPIRALLTDFGLAKLLEGDGATRSGTLMGTLAYMAPEQVLGGQVDGRCDLYAVGVMLYQIATGRLPFDIKTPTDAVLKHLHELPPAPQTVRADLPAPISALISRAIARNPADRYQTGQDLAWALRRVSRALGELPAASQEGGQNALSLSHAVATATGLLPALREQSAGVTDPPAARDEYLIVSKLGEVVDVVALSAPYLTVGRAPENDLVLAEPGISRQHLRLQRTRGGWSLMDLGSTNGTVLAGRHLKPQSLVTWPAGDDVQLGGCTLHWQVGSPIARLHQPPPEPLPRDDRPERLLPPWVWPIAVLVLLSAFGAAALLLNFASDRNALATATAQAVQATLAAGTQETVGALGTATRDQPARSTATIVAGTPPPGGTTTPPPPTMTPSPTQSASPAPIVTSSSGLRQEWRTSTSLLPGQVSYHFRAAGAGAIIATASADEPTVPLAARLQNPDGVVLADATGFGTVDLAAQTGIVAGEDWLLVVTTALESDAALTISLTFPTASGPQTVVDVARTGGNHARAVAVLVADGAGTIDVRASWSPSSSGDLSLSLHGATTNDAVISVDGPSPLSLQFVLIDAANVTWLAALSGSTALGSAATFDLSYP